MAENQFLPFATGDGANTLAFAAYATQGYLEQGFQAGVAQPYDINTVLRQVTTVAAGLGQFTADNQAADVLDDGIPANFETKFTAALKSVLSSSSVHFGVATGTGDAMVVAASPPLVATSGGGYQPGSFLVIKTPASPNASTAPTVNGNSIANIAVTKSNAQPVAPGDLPGLTWKILFFDGVGCYMLSAAKSDLPAATTIPGATAGVKLVNGDYELDIVDLPGSPTVAASDVFPLQTTGVDASRGLSAEEVFTSSVQGLANFILAQFKAENTFVSAPTSATAVQATFGMAADQPVSSGVTTTVALAGQNAPFASIANGQITITETGIYNFSATLLGNSHQPSGELQYAVVELNQNGNLLEQTLTSVLSFGSALIAAGAGRSAFCSAGDVITLALYTHSQNFDDTGDTITASGTSLTIVKEA